MYKTPHITYVQNYFCTYLFLFIYGKYEQNPLTLEKSAFQRFEWVLSETFWKNCFSVPKLQMPYLQAFSCFLQNPKPVLSLILSLDKTIGCRTFPPSDCLKMFKLLPEGIKNPCIFHSHGKMITGSGYATPAWGR